MGSEMCIRDRDDIMLQYDAATRLVKKYLGTKVELVLPGRSSDEQTEAKPTIVNVVHFLAILMTSDLYTSPEHYHCQSISTPSSHSITLTRTLSSCTEHYRIWTEHLQTIVFCRALSNDSVLSKPDSVLCKPESVLVQLDRVLAW